jgi:general secretion pathway protein E
LCPECKKPYQASEKDCELLNVPAGSSPVLYKPDGCDACNHLGYRGRRGIYEVIEVDDQLRNMIHDGSGEHVMETYARTRGPSIRDDGIALALKGETSLEEVLRVTREN